MVVVRFTEGLCKVLSLFVSERNRKVIVSNVNTYVVAYSRLRYGKKRREINRRQINPMKTVANVTEASSLAVCFISIFVFRLCL